MDMIASTRVCDRPVRMRGGREGSENDFAKTSILNDLSRNKCLDLRLLLGNLVSRTLATNLVFISNLPDPRSAIHLNPLVRRPLDSLKYGVLPSTAQFLNHCIVGGSFGGSK